MSVNNVGPPHRDTGCSYTNSCLKCDLILCRYEFGEGASALKTAIALTERVANEKTRRYEMSVRVNPKAIDLGIKVAKEHNVTVTAMISAIRTPDVVTARFQWEREMRDVLDLTLKEIGLIVGGRDHSTIIYGLLRAEGNSAKKVQTAMRHGESAGLHASKVSA